MQLSHRPPSTLYPVVAHSRLSVKRMLPTSADPAPNCNKRPRISRSDTPTSAISLVSHVASQPTNSPAFSPHPSPLYAMRSHLQPASCDSPHFSPSPCVKPYLDHTDVCDSQLRNSPYLSAHLSQHYVPSPSFSPKPFEPARVHSAQHAALHQPHAHQWNDADLISAVCAHLQALCDHNNNGGTQTAADSPHKYHAFFSQYRQPFELSFYISRLVQFCNCSLSAFIVALTFLQRVQHQCAQLRVNHMNVHRLFCTALVLAIKNVDDEVFSNGYYARVGGITLEELNELERLMLQLLHWNVSCAVERYEQLEKGLLHRLALLVVHSDDDDEEPAVTCAA